MPKTRKTIAMNLSFMLLMIEIMNTLTQQNFKKQLMKQCLTATMEEYL